MPEQELVAIGHVVNAHGIRGEVSVAFHADSPALLDGELYLQAGSGSPRRRTTVSRRSNGARLLLRFEGVTDRNAAELLRGSRILVPFSALPPPGEGEYYRHELVGFVVLDVSDAGHARPLGRIRTVAEPAGQELWTIVDADGRELLFPAVPEFVLGIDPGDKTVRVNPPPGLTELYT
jgi:16S rRNA processing protein RimM